MNARSTDSEVSEPQLVVQAHSVSRALNIIGDRWSLLLLYHVFLGVRRYSDLLALTGIARSVLANRLQRLEKAGLLRRRRYQTRPPRYEYCLTVRGRDLNDVAAMLIRWDRRWHPDPQSLMHFILHRGCRQPTLPELRCAVCGEPVLAREVEWRPGPGAGVDPHPGPRAHRRSSLAEDSASALLLLQRSFDILGDRWTAMTVAAAFYRHRRFGEFQAALGIATNILSERLARLVELGVLERGADARDGYRLTEQGLDLFPIIVTLLRWGDRWLAGRKGPPLLLFHRRCGALLQPVAACDACGETLAYGDLQLSPEAEDALWKTAAATLPAAPRVPAGRRGSGRRSPGG
ncbi:MAG TPA: helix-turn-helix domain-containing protein [Solimonas sp.]|nr:helix-turn-helix domain-containing protein [Solimonas sp.]